MPKRATILRQTVWYQRFKQLAQSMDGKGAADMLRTVHQFLDSNFRYGSATTAAAAHDSVELIIEELHLNGAKSTLVGKEFEFELDMDSLPEGFSEAWENQMLEQVQKRFGRDKSGDDIKDYRYIFRCHITMK